MDDWVYFERDERHIKRERAKARELRKTPYFQELLRKGICHYCGKKFPPEELTFDHIVPVVRGGRSTRGNMVVSKPNPASGKTVCFMSETGEHPNSRLSI